VAYTITAVPPVGFGLSAPAEGAFTETLTSGQNAGPFDFGVIYVPYM